MTKTAAKTTRKSKKTEVAAVETAAPLAIAMSTEAILSVADTGDAALDALMAELNGVDLPGDDEVVLPSEPAGAEFEVGLEAADTGAAEDLLATAVAGAELIESYDADAETAAILTPLDAVAPTEASAEDKKAAKKAKEPKEPKAPKAPKTFYGLDKVKRLTDRGVYAVMLKSEEALSGAELEAAQQRTIDVVAKSNQKVKNRTTNILEYATGKTNVLNNLIRVCLQVLDKDGVLTTGEKGNMWATMSVCYGAGTIRSGGNNSVAALRDLGVIVQDAAAKGYVVNHESALYSRIKARLDAGASESVPVAEEALDVEPASAEPGAAETEAALEEAAV